MNIVVDVDDNGCVCSCCPLPPSRRSGGTSKADGGGVCWGTGRDTGCNAGVGEISEVGGGEGANTFEVELVAGGGGANPDDKIGSDDPVSKEAAVAAAATLQKTKVNKKIRLMTLVRT